MTSELNNFPLENGEIFRTSTHVKNVLSSIYWGVMLATGTLAYGSYTIFVHLCEVDGNIPFSSSSMVLMTEICKLLTSLVMFLPQARESGFLLPPSSFCLPFAVPAVLYCINNNLAVHMQLHMDPATYQVLGNMKIASTALLYRFIIKRGISNIQWVSIVLLTLAGLSDSYGGLRSDHETSPAEMHITVVGLLMITTYCTISGLAGVYSEYILKKHYSISLHYQNILLYTFCIICNLISWISQETATQNIDSKYDLFRGYSWYTVIIIVTQTFIGLMMSVIMKHASNITRLFIVSSAMLVTTVLSVMVFSAQLNSFFIVSCLLVIIALVLYHRT